MSNSADTRAPPSAWIEVPQFDWQALAAQGAGRVRFHKGQTLFSQGDPVDHVYVVEEGRVRLVLLSADGHEKHLAIVGSHGMVGECSAFLDGRHSVSAIASSEVVALQVERRQLLLGMERDPACLRQVLWLSNVKFRVLAQQNLLLSHAAAAQRVVHHLVQLADTYGDVHGSEVDIRISFTHQEMANITGLSRVMTSNVLTRLQDHGLIEMSKSHCVIRDFEGLRRRALDK